METLDDLLEKVSPRLTDIEYQEFLQKLVPAYKRMEKHLDKQYRKRLWKSFPKREGSINDEMIAKAKEHPIENLIEVQRGYALCLFHDDHKPSMRIKDNRGKCFSCGMSADAIDVYQKIHKCSFQDAVRSLI